MLIKVGREVEVNNLSIGLCGMNRTSFRLHGIGKKELCVGKVPCYFNWAGPIH